MPDLLFIEHHYCSRTYTVGIFAFGRAELYYLFVFALCEGKNERNESGSTMLPRANTYRDTCVSHIL